MKSSKGWRGTLKAWILTEKVHDGTHLDLSRSDLRTKLPTLRANVVVFTIGYDYAMLYE